MNRTAERIIVVDMTSAERLEENEENDFLEEVVPHEPVQRVLVWSSFPGRRIEHGPFTNEKYVFDCGEATHVVWEDAQVLLFESFFSDEEP